MVMFRGVSLLDPMLKYESILGTWEFFGCAGQIESAGNVAIGDNYAVSVQAAIDDCKTWRHVRRSSDILYPRE